MEKVKTYVHIEELNHIMEVIKDLDNEYIASNIENYLNAYDYGCLLEYLKSIRVSFNDFISAFYLNINDLNMRIDMHNNIHLEIDMYIYDYIIGTMYLDYNGDPVEVMLEV